LKPSLQLRLSQHLALTPQLQQSIRLLQLSTLELNQEIEQAVSENPLLERLDDPFDHAYRIEPNGSLTMSRATAPGEPAGGGSREDGAEGGGERTDEARERAADETRDSDWGWESANRQSDDEESSVQQVATNGRTLHDHLSGQLGATQASQRDRALVGVLIDNLDEAGFLDGDLAEIAATLPPELEIEPEELSAALRLLQSFDPPGIGARDLSECLRLQLAALAASVPAPDTQTLALAQEIARAHLQLLADRDFTRLRRLLRCDDEALRAAHALIRQLDPHPGAAFSIDEPNYVVPDVIVRKVRGAWQATLNPEVVPKLRVNDVYAKILRANRGGPGGGLGTQLQEARWLIRNVQQRFDTILRVSQAIVERQRAFFSHGAIAMRPLVLREIAQELGLHESTISRVTTQKFMLPPMERSN
jgi:RNA polymerase sigma-54 factor